VQIFLAYANANLFLLLDKQFLEKRTIVLKTALIKIFNQCCFELSASNYPTISMVHPIMHALLSSMQASSTDGKLTAVLKKCLLHYTDAYMIKYIEINEDWYCAASFLDLRFKMFIRLAPNVRQVCIEKAKAKLIEIVRAGPEDIKSMAEYNSRPASTQQPTQIISLSCLPKFDFMDADSTAAQNKSKKKSKLEREIELYMSEPFKKIDPCEYWKQNKSTYPALFYCAKILLTIPASSVPSESLFSEAAQQITSYRNRLLPDKVNKIMVIKGSI
jgi:hypothetical protein